MNTLQDQPQTNRNASNKSQAGDTSESYQSQQQARDQRPQNDRDQSGQDEDRSPSPATTGSRPEGRLRQSRDVIAETGSRQRTASATRRRRRVLRTDWPLVSWHFPVDAGLCPSRRRTPVRADAA